MDIPYSVDDIAYVHFGVHPEDLSESSGYNYREYQTDVDCFLSHECNLIQYQSEVQSFLPLGIEVIGYIFSEARWVETEFGTAYIQRRWHTEKAEVSVDWVNLNSEYGFILSLPQADGTVKRIEALWLDMTFDGLPISEDLATQLALGALKDSIEVTTNYLDEQQ